MSTIFLCRPTMMATAQPTSHFFKTVSGISKTTSVAARARIYLEGQAMCRQYETMMETVKLIQLCSDPGPVSGLLQRARTTHSSSKCWEVSEIFQFLRSNARAAGRVTATQLAA